MSFQHAKGPRNSRNDVRGKPIMALRASTVRIVSLEAAILNVDLGPPNSATPSVSGLISVFGQSNSQQGVVINGSAGKDGVRIDGLHAGDRIFAALEAGSDRLTVRNNSSPEAIFNGGHGFDKLFVGEGNAFDELEQTDFE